MLRKKLLVFYDFVSFFRNTLISDHAYTCLINFLSFDHKHFRLKKGISKAYVETINLKNDYTVCKFQSMKSLVELNCLFSKFFCYIT